MVFWASIQLIGLAVAIGLAVTTGLAFTIGLAAADLAFAIMLLMLKLVSLLGLFM
jgi:hypothetical protein